MNNFFIKIITSEKQSFYETVENNSHSNPLDKSLNHLYVFDRLHMTFSKNNFDLLKPEINQDYIVLSSISYEDKEYLCNKYDLSFELSSSKMILELYLKFGKKIFKNLGNKFFLFLYDTKNKNFSIFRDHIGFYNIYFTETNEDILLSSRLVFIKNDKTNIKFKINQNNLKKFLHMTPISKSETFFEKIKKVPATCSLSLKNTFLELEYYEKFRDINLDKNPKKQIIGLKEELRKAVIRFSERNDKKLGFLFSGGLDSSTVISFYRKFRELDQKLYAFSGRFSHIDNNVKHLIDEKKFQNEIMKFNDIEDRSFETENISTLIDIDRYLNLIGQPFFFPNLYVPNEAFKMASKEGISKVFNGNDGDSVISHGYEYFLELFLKFKWIKLFRNLNKTSKIFKKPIKFVFKRTVLNQIYFYNKIYFSAKEKHKAILNTSIHSDAIEIQSIIAGDFGVEEVYPFYNMNLVNYCTNVRPDLKVNGYSRSILREAIKGIVPEKIRLRTDKANLGHEITRSLINNDKVFVRNQLENPHEKILDLVDISLLRSHWKNILLDPRKYSTGSNIPSLIYSYLVANRWLQLNDN